jgi:hypothetical protein
VFAVNQDKTRQDKTRQGTTMNRIITVANKPMSLDDARCELEQQGFECFGGDEEEGILTGRRSKFYKCTYLGGGPLDLLVFVYRVNELKLERVYTDLANVPDRVAQYAFGKFGGLFPGMGRRRAGHMIFVIYYADLIEPAVSAKIVQEAPDHDCWNTTFTFLAAQDGQGQSLFFEGTPPGWGRQYYTELHYWAGLLTGRDVGKDGPPVTGIFSLLLFYIWLMYSVQWIEYSDNFWLPFLKVAVSFACLIAVVFVFECIKSARREMQRSRRYHR